MLASDGPYTVKLIDSLRIGQEEFTLSFRKRDASVFNVNLAELCSAALELQRADQSAIGEIFQH